ncbi:hypothetical protein C8A05DRAFT_15070 [Staphylotrichum tortipilum]|uniref:Cell cycle control protein n=1 Tax=Staphylotrichum tortipilum TaxID=2831512 RepID=A0AAN6MLR0_9PEZI|nr:hypothetical protein C8A05DRAFT_15070 [Staphylotrichum longicolle]
MDPAEIIDLDDIPSDAFDLDERDLDPSRSPSVMDDYGSWPADLSPVPGLGEFDEEDREEDEEDEEDEEEEDEEDIEEEEDDEEEDEDGEDIDDDEDDDMYGHALDHLGMDHVYMDPLGPLDPLDVADLDAVDWRPHDGIVEHLAALLPHWDRPASPSLHARRLLDRASNLFAALNAPQPRDRVSQSPSDALFVAQLRNAFPPIDVDALIRPDRPRPEDHDHHFGPRRSRSNRAPSFDPLGRVAAAGPSRDNNRPQNQPHNHLQNQPAPDNNMPRRNRGHRAGGRAHPRDELVELELEMQAARSADRRDRAPAVAEQEVIDLTNEPDSPGDPVIHADVPAHSRHRHRRRSNNQRAPSLARGGGGGDGGALPGNQATVIDLTLDDDDAADPPPRPQHLPRRSHPDNNNNNGANNRQHHRHANHREPVLFPHHIPLIDLEDDAGFNANINNLVRTFGHIHEHIRQRFNRDPPQNLPDILRLGAHPNMDNPIANNLPNFDYAGAGGPPKHIPPPPARPGFTRDTRGGGTDNLVDAEESDGDDEVFICPGCEHELAYDPNPDKEEEQAARPAKKPRTRKDREEHYFWALKACGHVYCKECYESRGARPKNPDAKFRKHPQNPRKVLCAVEDCTTETSSKSGWVGLFI